MRMLSVLVLCLALSGPLLAQPKSEKTLPELPKYKCLRTSSPPQIDGLLSEPMWRQTPRIYLWECIAAGRPQQRTTVRMRWDNNYLYVAARLYETDIRSELTGRDAAVYSEQCFEVFLQEGASPFQYWETDVSPLNTLFDSRIFNDGEHFQVHNAYNPRDLATAVERHGTINEPYDSDRCWTVEMAIPFRAVPTATRQLPRSGECWRINLYRIHNWDEPDEEISAWSPTGARNFHVPERFGWIQFITGPDL